MITCHNVFNVWPKTTLVLPVWLRDAESTGTPALHSLAAAALVTGLTAAVLVPQ